MSRYVLSYPHPLFGGMCMRREPRSDLLDLAPAVGQLFDQSFGLGLAEDDLWPSSELSLYVRPRRNFDRSTSGVSTVESDADCFKVSLDVNQFRPDELSVKTVDNTVVVHGLHEERRDQHGFISRQFTRRYVLPEGVRPDTLASSLTPEGILRISAPKQALEPPKPNERQVHIVPAAAISGGHQEQLPVERTNKTDEATKEPATSE